METQFSISQLLFLGYFVKTVVDFFKWVVEKEFSKWRIVAVVVGVISAVLLNADALPYLGLYPSIPSLDIKYIPLVGSVMTGAMAAYLGTDFFDVLNKFKTMLGGSGKGGEQLAELFKLLQQIIPSTPPK